MYCREDADDVGDDGSKACNHSFHTCFAILSGESECAFAREAANTIHARSTIGAYVTQAVVNVWKKLTQKYPEFYEYLQLDLQVTCGLFCRRSIGG